MSSTAQVSAGKRIEALLDDQSFVEIGAQITARSTDFNMPQKETPKDGVITGYGVIDGSLVYVYSQDVSVMNGSMGEMHARKIVNLYKMAIKMGAPVIGLIDCAGLRLQEATDALNAFGELYMQQTLASGVIPQITAIFGTCGGGMALTPALTDFTFMEKSAKLFVNAPNAIDGNHAGKCDNASAKFQSAQVGAVDVVGEEEAIITSIRTLIGVLPANNADNLSYEECTDNLNRPCENLENETQDPALALTDLSDNGFFFETKKEYAKEMVTGFIRMNGMTVGAVANRTATYDEKGEIAEKFDAALTARGCDKAAEFVKFCDAFEIPVLTLVNVKGYKAELSEEKWIAKAAAKLTFAFANATVPKISVITGEAYGSSYLAMNSKSIGADIVYALPNASIGMMDAEPAVRIMYAEEIKHADQTASLIAEKTSEYAQIQSSAIAAAKRGYVDDIIEPVDLRKYVIGSLEMLFTKREDRPSKKHGCV